MHVSNNVTSKTFHGFDIGLSPTIKNKYLSITRKIAQATHPGFLKHHAKDELHHTICKANTRQVQ